MVTPSRPNKCSCHSSSRHRPHLAQGSIREDVHRSTADAAQDLEVSIATDEAAAPAITVAAAPGVAGQAGGAVEALVVVVAVAVAVLVVAVAAVAAVLADAAAVHLVTLEVSGHKARVAASPIEAKAREVAGSRRGDP